ncbi:ABC transporter permease subunit [Streptomyces sp. NPDC002680]|uniref:ABC transporter permease subunit n=1 Tax=Streptomyces sp. NPDC002680 TaxID=3364659 RepID=UPI0036C6254A
MKRKELRPRPTRNPEADPAARTAGTATPGAESAAPSADSTGRGCESAPPTADPTASGAELAALDADPAASGGELAASGADPMASGGELAALDADPAASGAELAASDADPMASAVELPEPTADPAASGAELAASDADQTAPAAKLPASDADQTAPAAKLPASDADQTAPAAKLPAPTANQTAPGPESPAPKSGVAAAGGSLPRRIRRAAAMRGYDGLFRTALWVLVALVLVTLVGQLAGIGGRPDAIVGPRLSPPAAGWPLGTDNLGRSLLPRLFQGVGTTLLLSAFAVTCTAVISTALGVLAGYRGGRTAEVILRIGDVLYAFPAIVLAVLVAAVLGPGRTAALAAIVLVTVPLMTRMVGIAARAVARREFVTAARISGVRAPTIMLRHILPNVAGTVAVQGTYALSVGILVEGGLSFLGYGVQLPDASLGLLIQEGGLYMVGAPWLIVAPGVVLIAAIMAVNLIGDSLRDRFEPRETRSLV